MSQPVSAQALLRQESESQSHVQQIAIIIASDVEAVSADSHQEAFAVTTATRLGSVLQNSFGFEVDLVVGRDATLRNIAGSIDGLWEKAKPGDAIFVYIALPSSAEFDQLDFKSYEGERVGFVETFTGLELIDALSNLDYSNVLIASESCFSTSFGIRRVRLRVRSLDTISRCGDQPATQNLSVPVGSVLVKLLEERATVRRPWRSIEVQKLLTEMLPDLDIVSSRSQSGMEFSFFPRGQELDDFLVSQLDKDRPSGIRNDAIQDLQQSVNAASEENRVSLSTQVSGKLVEIALDEGDDIRLRQLAARMLPEFRFDGTVEGLSQIALQARTTRVREAALESLESIGDRQAIETIEVLVSTDDPAVRGMALESLAVLDSTSSLPLVIEQLEHENAVYPFRSGLEAAEILGAEADSIVAAIEANLLRSPSPELLGESIEYLADVGSERAQKLILPYTISGDVETRVTAVSALGLLGNKANSDVRISLDNALDDRDLRVRKSAITSIGLTGTQDPAVLENIQRVARKGDIDMRRAAINSLGAIGDSSSLLVLKNILAEDADNTLRYASAVAIGQLDNVTHYPIPIGHGRSVTTVLFLFQVSLREPTTYVRDAVRATMLDELDVDSDEIGTLVQEELEFCRRPVVKSNYFGLMLKGISPWTWGRRDESRCSLQNKTRALEWLALTKNPAILSELLEEFDSANDAFRQAALESVAQLTDEESIRSILVYLINPDPRKRILAAELLGAIGTPLAVDPLTFYASDENVQVREAVISALGRFSEQLAIDTVQRATTDENSHVRRAAFEALSNQVELMLIEDGEHAVALAQYTIGMRQESGDTGSYLLATSHLQLAKAQRKAGNLDEADQEVTNAQRIYPPSDRYHSGLAEVYGERAILRALQGNLVLSDLSIRYALDIGGPELVASIEELRELAESREDYTRVDQYDEYLYELRVGLRR